MPGPRESGGLAHYPKFAFKTGSRLPQVGFSLGDRDIGQEHALSLEFDGPTTSQKKAEPEVKARLLQEVTLTVDSVGAKLVMRGEGVETSLTLTRKESHLVLEMLANKARAVNWLDEVKWPSWLGSINEEATGH